MIVPRFWAEAKLKQRTKNRQVTVRRFGWSNVSQAEAQLHAETRVREALDRISAGERIDRRELKSAYNGAEGVPIREEVIASYGDVVITRNSYGAKCLNTPDVLIADIDFRDDIPGTWWLMGTAALVATSAAVAIVQHSWGGFLIGMFLSLVFGIFPAVVVHSILRRIQTDPETRHRRALSAFAENNPEWHLRVYRTPAGLRVLALHRTFDPEEDEVIRFFRTLGVDPVYQRMCQRQRCFRARLTAKPWRIGIPNHLKPRPGVWPVNPARLPERHAWLAEYDRVANDFAACRFLESIGSGSMDSKAASVLKLHDEKSRANEDLEIA